jgi:hypothetical protein
VIPVLKVKKKITLNRTGTKKIADVEKIQLFEMAQYIPGPRHL